ncbi:unnamed protein product [Acanthosepion pharaonis]|uniref:Uncharacterized protein n=1 Tax=Acanthosepion pharaonis TaxID=158019 RepID=A0A812DCD1_ACAPH|nr:unnamed protein product [Sepia pharaonis]
MENNYLHFQLDCYHSLFFFYPLLLCSSLLHLSLFVYISLLSYFLPFPTSSFTPFFFQNLPLPPFTHDCFLSTLLSLFLSLSKSFVSFFLSTSYKQFFFFLLTTYFLLLVVVPLSTFFPSSTFLLLPYITITPLLSLHIFSHYQPLLSLSFLFPIYLTFSIYLLFKLNIFTTNSYIKFSLFSFSHSLSLKFASYSSASSLFSSYYLSRSPSSFSNILSSCPSFLLLQSIILLDQTCFSKYDIYLSLNSLHSFSYLLTFLFPFFFHHSLSLLNLLFPLFSLFFQLFNLIFLSSFFHLPFSLSLLFFPYLIVLVYFASSFSLSVYLFRFFFILPPFYPV